MVKLIFGFRLVRNIDDVFYNEKTKNEYIETKIN